MDEEEELENTLIGQQEEVPALGTEDALMGGLGLGTLSFASQTGRAPTPTSQGPLSPFAQQVAANDAARQATTGGVSLPKEESSFTNDLVQSIGNFFTGGRDVSGRGGSMGLPPTFTPPSADATPSEGAVDIQPITLESIGLESPQQRILRERGETQGTMGIAKVNPTGTMGIAKIDPTLPPAAQSFFGEAPASSSSEAGQRLINAGNNVVESTPSLPEGVQEGSPQANFLNRMRSGEALTQEEINAANALAESIGTTFDPVTGYNRDPFLSSQASRTSTPLPGQSLTQFLRNEDAPEQRTEQFVDPQGRLRRRFTPEASALQGFAPGVQPLAPEFTSFQQASDDLQQRIRDRERRPGESQTERDTRIAQERTQGSTTGDDTLSFNDARKRVARKDGESVRSYNERVRAYMAGQAERDLERRAEETRIRAQEADIARDEAKIGFEPRIVTVEGERTLELSPGYFQRLQKDTPEKTGLESTLEDLQADLKSGRLTQDQYQIAVRNATNLYIGLKEPKPSSSNTNSEFQNIIEASRGGEAGSEFTPKQEADIQKVLAANPDRTRAEVIEAMDKEGKL